MTPTRSIPRRVLGGAASLALALGVSVGALVTVGATSSVAATTIGPVDHTIPDGNNGSLREILENEISDGDTVVLEPGVTYVLDNCEAGDIGIDGVVTIQGNGATIEQTCPDRVLYTQDEITLENVTVTGGDVEGPGGGLFEDSDNPITLTGVTFTANTASDSGGGVATSGDISVSDSTFSDNTDTGGDGGGIKVFSDVGTTTITNSTFTGNSTDGWGGAWEQQGRDTESAAASPYVLQVSGSTFTGNTADGDGGGALDTEDDATITIDHSTLSGNSGGWGGAVGTFGQVTSFSSNASTFSGNTSADDGGAVHMSGGEVPVPLAAVDASSTNAQFVNSTITGNTEASFGAIAVEGELSLNQVTLTNNTSRGQQSETKSSSNRGNVGAFAVDGDAANVAAFTFTSRNSVVAQPVGAANCTEFETPATDGGYNFSDDTSCGFTDPTSNVKTPNDPVLGALANNGGPTQTLLPLTGSPLLDAIPPASCGADVDQRGITRPQGAGCDIGAVEVEVVAPTPAPAAVVITPKFTG